MRLADLVDLVAKHFPDSEIPEPILELSVGSLPEWDSLGHISLLISIEEHYGIRFSVDEMTELTSIRDIASSLESRGIEA